MSTLLGPCEIGGGGGRVAEDDVKEVTDEIKLGPCEIGGGGGNVQRGEHSSKVHL